MAAGFLSLIAAAMAAALQPAALVGEYDGGQTEIAAGIELRADGRFRYGLSYGALDEQAEGRWRAEGNQVLLTSDPVKAPQFTLLTKQKGAPNALEIEIQRPEGLPLGLFDVAVTFKSGRMQIEQLSEEGLQFDPADPPTNIFLALRIFDLVGDPVPVSPAEGYRLSLRFDPNDLGKVDFRDAALTIDGKDLLLERHERKLRFRRISR